MSRSQNCLHPPAFPSSPLSFSALSVNSVLRKTRSLTHIDPLELPPSPRHSSASVIPFRITSFADPHPLTPIESHLCKKQGRGWGIKGPNPTQPLPHFPTTSKHPTRSNARNSITFMPLLHNLRTPPGGGTPTLCHSEPSAEPAFSVPCLVTSLPPYFSTSHFHGPRPPRPLQLFNPQLSTSSSTIPALHSGADFTQGDR
jgi:hypothetical protein